LWFVAVSLSFKLGELSESEMFFRDWLGCFVLFFRCYKKQDMLHGMYDSFDGSKADRLCHEDFFIKANNSAS
jgi:hypothetical protein